MTDIILESLRAIVVGLTLIIVIRRQTSRELHTADGWQILFFGLVLIFFGTLIDITDNFTELNRFVIVGDTPVQAFLEKIVGYLLGFMLLAVGIWRWLPKVIEHQEMVAANLKKAKDEVNILRGLLPICASCKDIRDDKGYWKQIEAYITEHSDAKFSHSICPSCMEKLYPDAYERIKERESMRSGSIDLP